MPPAPAEHARPDGASPIDGPPRARRRLIVLGLLGFVALSAFHALTGREHWPFSPYAMYSTIKSPENAVKLVLVAVEPDGREDRLLRSRDAPGDLCTVPASRHPGAAGFRLDRAESRHLSDASNLETPESPDLLAEGSSPAAAGRSRS